MPTYIFRCKKCGFEQEEFCSMSEFDSLRNNLYHCDSLMGNIISAGRGFFRRSSFNPNEVFEHCGTEPRSFRDKHEMLDHCEEHGLRSAYLEDGDIP